MVLQASPPSDVLKSVFHQTNPSRFLANIFLLAGIGLLVISGRIVEGTLAQYLVGGFAEILLAVTAIACVKLNKLPVKATMRFNWPGWEPVILSFIAAPGLWMMGVTLNVITSLILGYTTPTPPQMYPTNVLESLGFVITAVIIAPICEEIMFRGYVQRAYERGKPLLGILAVGIIFALYHMQFQGFFALVPVALALSLFAWRTDSILPGMILHAAYNSIATLILITATFLPYQVASAFFVTLILIGLAGIGGTALAIWRLWNISDPKALPQPVKAARLTQWAWIIPLLILVLIYTFGSINEVIAGKFPELLATAELEFKPQPAWQEKQSWEYEIQDIIGTPLGSAECTLKPYESAYLLSCRGHNQNSSVLERIPWEIPWLSEKFNITAGDWERKVLWNESNLQISELSEYQHLQNRLMTMNSNNQVLIIKDEDAFSSELDIPADALVVGEWPWRLAGLPLDLFYSGYIPLVTLNHEGAIDLYEAFLTVKSAEPTWTTAGSFITWKVTVTYTDDAGNKMTEQAWYDTIPPHPLIRYDDGQLSYVMRTNKIQDK